MSTRREVAEGLRTRVSRTFGRLLLRTHEQLVERSPKLSGWLAAKWAPAAGAADTSSPARPSGSDLEARRAEASALLGQHVQRAHELDATYDIGDGTLHVTNDAPYAVEANAGSSSKAPAMFVEQGIAAAVEQVAGEKLAP